MINISSDLIKELREKTSVGILDCRKALTEAEGNIEKAVEILRKKGVAVAAKRADNTTDNGTIQAYVSPEFNLGSLVEMNCETDFSANTDDMRNFAQQAAHNAAHLGANVNAVVEGSATHTELMGSTAKSGLTLKDSLNELIAKITESIKLRHFVTYKATSHEVVNVYIHAGNTLAVMAEISSDKDLGAHRATVAQLVKDVCMQAAVTNPLCIDPSGMNQDLVTKERNIIEDQLKASGKPAEMIAKITEGKLEKYYEEVCLENQKFIKNDKLTVKAHVAEVGKTVGANLKIVRFVRFAVGK